MNVEVSNSLQINKADVPTRAGEQIKSIVEIPSVPTPCVGMVIYVKDERRRYVVNSLKDVVVGGIVVANGQVDEVEILPTEGEVNAVVESYLHLTEGLSNGEFVVKVAALANAVKAGAITFDMLSGELKLSNTVVDDLNTENTLMPLSANQGKILKDLIDVINGSGEGSTDKKITDAINAFASRITADGTINTFKEVLDWISVHAADFTALVGQVQRNTNNVSGLQDEVGELATYVDEIYNDVEKIKNGKVYLTESQYKELEKNNLIKDDVEYNIFEDE